MSTKTEVREQSIATLKRMIPTSGTTIYAILRQRSRSGMSRKVSFHVVIHGETREYVQNISGWCAELSGYRRDDKTGAVIVPGVGFDAAQDVVRDVATALFGDPEAIRYEWIN